MNRIALTLFATILVSCNSSTQEKGDQHAGHHEDTATASTAEKAPLSPRTASMSNVGENHIHIDYGSPSKRNRVIFGGLVGYGQVWATGAHKATFIDFSKDVIIGDKNVPAGKYGLFTIPGESQWIIIINKDWDMHLADDYKEENDIVRIESPVVKLDEVVESLTFNVEQTASNTAIVSIRWDQTQVTFEVLNN